MSNLLDQRLLKVCRYIHHHLDEPLSLEQLSEIACASKYHFHRIFQVALGMSVMQYAQRLRLKRASMQLAFESDGIITIALAAGFNSHEAFSRAFKRQTGQSPSEFRAKPDWLRWHQALAVPNHEQEAVMNVKIVNFPEITIAYLRHQGNPKQVLETAAQFIAWRKHSGQSPIATSRTFGIPYSDPNVTPPDEFRWDVCGSITTDIQQNDFGIKQGVIPAGRCAVARHKGSHNDIDTTVYALYRDWFPDSGEQLRDYPCFFEYLNFQHQVAESDLLTDVYLPIL